MFYKRWYDQTPTLSIAVSLLQNTSLENRMKTVSFLITQLESDYPEALEMADQAKSGWLSFIQRRQTMEQNAWQAVETLQFVPEEGRHELALAVIRTIYQLENDQAEDLDLVDLTLLGIAV